ncbi:UDP-glucosyltransferase 2 [Amyelois transitella]|uniref:UDP-glucosyltransferase 2 n=1 Tax=Amyelois transitella TaxID=680683 RepID=UPI00299076C5|nr:UDP-glucosyltransferase 2 [Amyelois transitella]XP_060804914.1 UDP-glucosyltransferase 2 [Amyelois transitella]
MRAILLLLSTLSVVYGYKILCVFPVPSPSHNTLGKGIVNALLKGGHQVTWVTPYPFKNENKNLTIIPSRTEMLGKDHNMADPKYAKSGISFVKQFGRNISHATIENELFRKVLINEQFDAVCTEWFFNKLFAGFAAIQQVPWILLNSVTYNAFMEEIVDEVRSLSTIPLLINDAPVPMNLLQRLKNTWIYSMVAVSEWLDSFSAQEEFETYFAPLAAARGVPLPLFSEIEKNVSVLFVNSHPSFDVPFPMPPNVVPIAGYHIPEYVPPLPNDLQTILDNSPNGVVYFSLGSVIQTSNLPEHTLKDLIRILGELPYTVLWKFEKEFTGLPKNVHIRPWMPQPSILAHPNVKLFITHGGMLSSLESLQFGVPLLAVPVFGDQPSNAARATNAGYAKTVPFSHDMGPKLQAVLKEMLSDDKYYKRAKYLSALFHNREVAPSKLISHYVEVAIESKGAYHLRSPTRLYAWYKRWMLDQLAILLAVVYLLVVIVKKLFSLGSSSKEMSNIKKKRN